MEVDPTVAGFDAGALAAAVAKAESTERLLSLVVLRHGRLVSESYFRGNNRDALNDVRSVTKSVVGALVGIAIEEGDVDGLDQTIGELLATSSISLTAEQEAIKVRDLLTMTSGFEWDESTTSGYNDWVTSPDPLRYVLDRPLAHPPGSTFTYNSAAVHLLGVVLEEATGTPLPTFAEQHLFAPLGITDVAWEQIAVNRVNGGAGIDLRPRDLAKFGQLMLQDGISGSTAVLPSGWVMQLTTPQFAWRTRYGPLLNMSYGSLWWTEDAGPNQRAFLAWGYGGQFIYVVPGQDLVMVATTDWRGVGSSSDSVARGALELLVSDVVAAAR